MARIEEIAAAVRKTLDGKRLGRPVFVRCTLQGPDKDDALLARLAAAAALVQGWLGQPLDRLVAVGSAEAGQVALTLRFRDGAAALLSYAHGRPRGDGVDLIVLGNHGAIYYDAGAAPWDEPAGDGPAPPPALLDLVRRALRSGKPEPAGAGGEP